MAKIVKVTEDEIIFDDESVIAYDHEPDCCEWNYADFKQLDDIARATEFDTKHMKFESVEDAGFRFGNDNKMFFVPCYSSQNGYYSSEISIYYNNERVLSFCAELMD